jgi:hypothetical protein
MGNPRKLSPLAVAASCPPGVRKLIADSGSSGSGGGGGGGPVLVLVQEEEPEDHARGWKAGRGCCVLERQGADLLDTLYAVGQSPPLK